MLLMIAPIVRQIGIQIEIIVTLHKTALIISAPDVADYYRHQTHI